MLLLGDLAALYLFVLAGQLDHELLPGTNPLWYTLTRALPFIAVWLATSWLLGTYWQPLATGRRRFSALGVSAMHAWAVAAPLGVLLRALLLGRATIPTLFLVTTLGFGTLFLLAWRLFFGLIYQARQR